LREQPGDNSSSPSYDFSANGVDVKAIVAGRTIPVLFAGRAGYAGEDQINFQLPADVPTGCTVSFQVSVDGVLSNPTFIAIAPDAKSTACDQPGFTTSQLQHFDNGASQTFGSFSLNQFSALTYKVDSANGGFTSYTGFQLDALVRAQGRTAPSGSCTNSHLLSLINAPPLLQTLDAGTVTLSGPEGSQLAN
jgi:hypothetical protein